MNKIWKYGKRYVFLYIIAITVMILSILLDAASPQITKRIIDQVIIGGQMGLRESRVPVYEGVYF